MTTYRRFEFKPGTIIAATLMVLSLISGCATLDKNECLNADWRTIGYEDGSRGYSGSYIANHRKACSDHGVTPDLNLYEEGRQMGLREYCTPGNGYRLGVSGKRYNGTCPSDLDPGFRHAMEEGHKLYVLEKDLRQQRRTLEIAYKDLDALAMEIADTEAALIKPKVSPHHRKELLDELRMLEDQHDALLLEISEMERALDRMQRNVARVRDQNPYE